VPRAFAVGCDAAALARQLPTLLGETSFAGRDLLHRPTEQLPPARQSAENDRSVDQDPPPRGNAFCAPRNAQVAPTANTRH